MKFKIADLFLFTVWCVLVAASVAQVRDGKQTELFCLYSIGALLLLPNSTLGTKPATLRSFFALSGLAIVMVSMQMFRLSLFNVYARQNLFQGLPLLALVLAASSVSTLQVKSSRLRRCIELTFPACLLCIYVIWLMVSISIPENNNYAYTHYLIMGAGIGSACGFLAFYLWQFNRQWILKRQHWTKKE
ncbi:MAG: hypothetical protein AAFN77_11175 [Planctomycetota bacterium]